MSPRQNGTGTPKAKHFLKCFPDIYRSPLQPESVGRSKLEHTKAEGNSTKKTSQVFLF